VELLQENMVVEVVESLSMVKVLLEMTIMMVKDMVVGVVQIQDYLVLYFYHSHNRLNLRRN